MATDNVERPSRSPYFQLLSDTAKARYEEKLTFIDSVDPYAIPKKEWNNDPSILPRITYPDIVNYLVYSPSPYTLDDLRCYKGLEAYNQFVSGWVRDVSARAVGNSRRVIVHGRVMHSQRLRETPLHPWIIVERDGKILAAHCDCMAGLGETCTHVCAILFFVETKVRIRDSSTVTQEAAYWKLPTSMKTAEYLPLHSIDFTSAKSKKRKLDDSVSCTPQMTCTSANQTMETISPPSQDEMSDFFDKLNSCGGKSAILSVLPGHCKQFIPQKEAEFPDILTNLYSVEYESMSHDELLKKCDDVKITITENQAQCVEKSTRSQASENSWFLYRTGRVTASKMKSACRTNPDKPAMSLIRAICYPSKGFFSAATEWGCSHETEAREQYLDRMRPVHENFEIRDSGLVINPKYPHVGASPDGIISCDCCGEGVLEIKCPFCGKDKTINEYAASERSTCLQTGEEGQMSLKQDHAYMYQIQTQLGVCEAEFADFVVWTNSDLHFERILVIDDMWEEILNRSSELFQKAILPELMGKFYSRKGLM